MGSGWPCQGAVPRALLLLGPSTSRSHLHSLLLKSQSFQETYCPKVLCSSHSHSQCLHRHIWGDGGMGGGDHSLSRGPGKTRSQAGLLGLDVLFPYPRARPAALFFPHEGTPWESGNISKNRASTLFLPRRGGPLPCRALGPAVKSSNAAGGLARSTQNLPSSRFLGNSLPL